jgi:hypothetical protein
MELQAADCQCVICMLRHDSIQAGVYLHIAIREVGLEGHPLVQTDILCCSIRRTLGTIENACKFCAWYRKGRVLVMLA